MQRTPERCISSSLPDHSKLSGGKYRPVWHFTSKAAVEQYIRDDPVLGPRSSSIHVELIEDVQPGTRLLAVGEMISYRDIMATFTKVLGKKLAGDEGDKQVSDQKYKELVGRNQSHKDHILQC